VKPLDPHDPDDNAFVLVKELIVVLCCVFLRKIVCCAVGFAR
jgi:hypothetical protein